MSECTPGYQDTYEVTVVLSGVREDKETRITRRFKAEDHDHAILMMGIWLCDELIEELIIYPAKASPFAHNMQYHTEVWAEYVDENN